MLHNRDLLMKNFIVIIILLATVNAFGQNKPGNFVGVFPLEYFKLPVIRMDDNKIFLSDQGLKKGFIFDRKNLKKLAEFGGQGEAPGEFNMLFNMEMDDQYLYFSSIGKLSIFSKNGKLVREIKHQIDYDTCSPIGNGFVCLQRIPKKNNSDSLTYIISLFDQNLKIKKELFKTTIPAVFYLKDGKKISHLFKDCVEVHVYKDMIFVGTTEKDPYFIVFDREGRKLYEIKKDEVTRRQLTADEMDRIKAGIQKRQEGRQANIREKEEVELLGYIPAFITFFVNDDKIYVFQYPARDGTGVYIMDLKGNKISYKKEQMNSGLINSQFQYLLDGKLYFCSENDSEELELREFDIIK